MSESYTPSKQARTLSKSEIFTLIDPLFDPGLLVAEYWVENMRVSGTWLRRLATRYGDEIPVLIDPELDARAIAQPKWVRKNGVDGSDVYDVCVVFRDEVLQPFDVSQRALVVHESAHALFYWMDAAPTDHLLNECAAHIAEALFFRLRDDNIFEQWQEDNEYFMTAPHLSGEERFTARAKTFREADKLVMKHNLHKPLERSSGPPRLDRRDVGALYNEIAQVKDYQH